MFLSFRRFGALAAFSLLTVPGYAAPPHCAVLSAPETDADFTAPLQTTIDACAAKGGGRVTLRAGRYEIAPIQLRSGVELHLEKDAVLQGSADHSRYRRAFINGAYQSGEALIGGEDIHDVAITGAGTIDGQGQSWWADEYAWRHQPPPAGIPASNGAPRPWLIETFRAQRVVITGVHIRNAPMWNIVLRYTQHARIADVDIRNPADAPNTDGIDVVASQDVEIERSAITTGDDDIALKSGLAGSTLPATPTQNVRIRALRIGRGHGLSIGSETLFGIRDVAVEDIAFDGTDNGIRIKSGRDRGSQLTDFRFAHLTMHAVGTAISISDYYPHLAEETDPPQPTTATTPYIARVTIQDLQGDAQNAGLIVGLPEAPLRAIGLNRVCLQTAQPLRIRHADVILQAVTVNGPQPPILSERGARRRDARSQ